MWLLLTSRIRRWVVLAVASPLLGLAARQRGLRMSSRPQPSTSRVAGQPTRTAWSGMGGTRLLLRTKV